MKMKVRLLLALVCSAVFGFHSAEARSINDIPAAQEALLRIVSPKFYRSLLIRLSRDGSSFVATWSKITLRGHVSIKPAWTQRALAGRSWSIS